MQTTKQIAKHFHDCYFGGNWTTVDLKKLMEGLTVEQATTKVYDLNTIATIVYHLNYFVHEVSKVLEGSPLLAKDKYSFDHPPLNTQEDWEQFLEQVWKDGKHFAQLIEGLDDAILKQDFSDNKYGNYFRNLFGIIEHTHYHLGQIAIVKKILLQQSAH